MKLWAVLEERRKLYAKAPNNIAFASSYAKVGNILESKGDYDEAIKYHEKSLELRIKKLGPYDLEVSDSYSCIGIILKNKRDYDRALIYYKKGL
jgi:tetratricopeptide (TPR) repeat protein